MTHSENLVVFITVQNLVGIASVILIIQKFEYFAHLAQKRLFTPFFVLWVKIGENGNFLHCYDCYNPELMLYEANHIKVGSTV